MPVRHYYTCAITVNAIFICLKKSYYQSIKKLIIIFPVISSFPINNKINGPSVEANVKSAGFEDNPPALFLPFCFFSSLISS